MSDLTFEFINTTAEAIDRVAPVKDEPTECQEIDDNKCGEIQLHYSGDFIFVCGFCYERHENMIDFGIHLKQRHEKTISNIQHHLKSTIVVECLVTTKAEDDPQQNIGFKSTTDKLQEKESSKTPFTCNNCGKSFKFQGRLRTHQGKTKCKRSGVDTQKSTSLPTFCSICNKRFKSIEFLKRHNTRYHEGETVIGAEATITDESVNGLPTNDASEPQLKTEREEENLSPNEEIELSSNEIEDIRDHVNDVNDTHQKVKQFSCATCARTFKSKAALAYHTNRHHDETSPKASDQQSRRCKYCNQEFQTKAQCTEHEGTHIGEKRFICWYCPHTFRTNYGRKRHMRVHTGERPFQCTECPKSFPHRVQLDYHIRKHKNLREFSCQTCGKSFYRKFELSLHERRHTGFRPLVCEDCGKTFNVTSELNEHRKRHTDVKDWKCEVCGKCFYTRWTLKDHMVGHSGETPFACNVCGRKFSRSKALKKHQKLHSDVKAYVCSICGKAYAQDSGLYAHKKTHGIRNTDMRNSVNKVS